MSAGMSGAMHTPAMCKSHAGSEFFSADMGGRGSWSKRFVCPDCKRTCRQNTNFLGSRHVVCNGQKFTLVADRLADLRDAGIDLKKEVAR